MSEVPKRKTGPGEICMGISPTSAPSRGIRDVAWNRKAVRRDASAQSVSPSHITAGSIQARSRHQSAGYQG